MSLVVEDGTGKDNAESYVSIEAINTYAVSTGKSFPIADDDQSVAAALVAAAEAAARRSTQWLDGKYRDRFPGKRLNGRAQALEWPRRNAIDASGERIASNEVPDEIKVACCEAAIRELAQPGIMAPDRARGGKIKSVGAGSTRVEYMDGAPAGTAFEAIDGILSSLLRSVRGSTSMLLRM